MAKVVLREHESSDELIKRFKRQVNNEGIIDEYRKHDYFLKKSMKRKEKSKRARNKK